MKLLLLASLTLAQAPAEKRWHERLSIRGYAQLRYSQIAESDPQLQCEQCDRSLGNTGGIFLRRGRIILSGDAHERVFVYLQPDFGSQASNTSLHFLQLRDAYFDLALDPLKEHRLRAGQSKVPYGFENLQSSQNRLPLDRADGLNSALANERDIGLFYYWAPAHIRERFALLVSSGLKGSGDYGVAGFGFYNGQTANRPEANRSLHAVMRLTYPWLLGTQFVEASIQGFAGRYVVTPSQASVGLAGEREHRDRRAAISLIVYPQPFGFQTEWTLGEGPEFDGPSGAVITKSLRGGYVQVMHRTPTSRGVFTPYARAQYYKGGKKHETDARRHLAREVEGGVEWQANKTVEITAAWSYANRTQEDLAARPSRHSGGRGRLQLQVNF
jgi:hypothetical protein